MNAYKNMADCFVRVVKEEGIPSLYKALPPRLFCVVPMMALQVSQIVLVPILFLYFLLLFQLCLFALSRLLMVNHLYAILLDIYFQFGFYEGIRSYFEEQNAKRAATSSAAPAKQRSRRMFSFKSAVPSIKPRKSTSASVFSRFFNHLKDDEEELIGEVATNSGIGNELFLLCILCMIN